MITTVCLNPAIDRSISIAEFTYGGMNRVKSVRNDAGGKGVNVSYVLRNLGRTSTAWGFIAGWTGAALEAALQEDGIPTGFVHLPQGNTRVNAKLKGTYVDIEGDMETAVNAGGAPIDDDSLQQFLREFHSRHRFSGAQNILPILFQYLQRRKERKYLLRQAESVFPLCSSFRLIDPRLLLRSQNQKSAQPLS